MAKLNMFNFITLNGFYKGLHEDISWHKHGYQEAAFSEKSAQGDGILLFGRVTYQMMAGYWPTPAAKQNMPSTAAGMSKAEKIVFSRTLTEADWENTRIVKSDLIEEVQKLKQGDKNITILGSGSIVSQLAEHNLIDTYQIMLDPVAIGKGTSIFSNISNELHLELTGTETFKSGVVLLNYKSKIAPHQAGS